MTEKIIYVLGDKLPTIYDVAISIYSNTVTNPNSAVMKYNIQAYVTALINVWIKAFGTRHLIGRRHITKKVEMIINNYFTHVYAESTRKKAIRKIKNQPFLTKTVRQLNREWSQNSIAWSVRSSDRIDSLFDIGCDMDKLTGDEKAFYVDQQTRRMATLSREIDMEYVLEEQLREQLEDEIAAREIR